MRQTRVFRYSMLPSLSVAAAMPAEVETRILDEEIEPIDYDSDPDLIGISCMTFNAPRAYEIADRFRFEKGKPVILGGYHPTFRPQEAVQHADSVCIGEAEPNLGRMVEDFLAGRLQPFYQDELADLRGLPRPFYARRRVTRRFWNQLRYLGWTAFTRVSVPLNLGYRARLRANGTLDLGHEFSAGHLVH